MLSITAGRRRLCDGLSRREVLRVGGAGLLGLTLPGLLQAGTTGQPRAKSVILFFLEGGPAHQDLHDSARGSANGHQTDQNPGNHHLSGPWRISNSSFIIHHSFVIRISSFVISPAAGHRPAYRRLPSI